MLATAPVNQRMFIGFTVPVASKLPPTVTECVAAVLASPTQIRKPPLERFADRICQITMLAGAQAQVHQ